MTDLAWRYDWQAAPTDSFQDWLLPVLLASANESKLTELTDATSEFTDVVLTIQVNGVEVDAERLVRRLEQERDQAVKIAARAMLDSVGFGDLERDFRQAEVAFRTALELRLQAAGIALPESED